MGKSVEKKPFFLKTERKWDIFAKIIDYLAKY